MPYYQGDYYAGDPGFFNVIGKIGGFIGRGAKMLGFPGAGVLTSVADRMAGSGIVKASQGSLMRRAGQIAGGAAAQIIRHPVMSAAGAAGVIGAMGAARAVTGGMGGMHLGRRASRGQPGQQGYHLAKSRHLRESGVWVRNRSLNPYNPRALHRAVRRATRFAKMAMHVIHIVHPKKKGRFGGFKKRRTKRA